MSQKVNLLLQRPPTLKCKLIYEKLTEIKRWRAQPAKPTIYNIIYSCSICMHNPQIECIRLVTFFLELAKFS